MVIAFKSHFELLLTKVNSKQAWVFSFGYMIDDEFKEQPGTAQEFVSGIT